MSTASLPATIRWRPNWWAALTGVLAVGDLLIGVASPLPSVRWPALAGGILILVALIWGGRGSWLGVAALVVGAVLPVVTTWWSLVTPVTAILVLACGIPALRSGRHPQPATSPAPVLVPSTRGGSPTL